MIWAALAAATAAFEMAERDTATRDVAALTPAAVVVAGTVAGEEGKLLADSALEPETADAAGKDPELLIAPMDMDPVAVIESKQEGEGVSSAL